MTVSLLIHSSRDIGEEAELSGLSDSPAVGDSPFPFAFPFSHKVFDASTAFSEPTR